jgi:purine-binding chemotaxis protein CheW
VLVFVLGAEEYGVDILKVQEIRGYEKVTPIPAAPDYLKGVMNLRGVIVPVVDLRVKFGLARAALRPFTVVVILRIASRVIGIVVDGVSDVVALHRERGEGRAALGTLVDSSFIAGLATQDERMVLLLDIEKLLSTRRAQPAASRSPPGGVSVSATSLRSAASRTCSRRWWWCCSCRGCGCRPRAASGAGDLPRRWCRSPRRRARARDEGRQYRGRARAAPRRRAVPQVAQAHAPLPAGRGRPRHHARALGRRLQANRKKLEMLTESVEEVIKLTETRSPRSARASAVVVAKANEQTEAAMSLLRRGASKGAGLLLASEFIKAYDTQLVNVTSHMTASAGADEMANHQKRVTEHAAVMEETFDGLRNMGFADLAHRLDSSVAMTRRRSTRATSSR